MMMGNPTRRNLLIGLVLVIMVLVVGALLLLSSGQEASDVTNQEMVSKTYTPTPLSSDTPPSTATQDTSTGGDIPDTPSPTFILDDVPETSEPESVTTSLPATQEPPIDIETTELASTPGSFSLATPTPLPSPTFAVQPTQSLSPPSGDDGGSDTSATAGEEPTEVAFVEEPIEYALQGVDGVVRLYHSDEIGIDDIAEVRLEIEITDERPVIVTLVRPAPTETPNLNPNAPTLTPISAAPRTDFIAVYDEMHAFLRGVDAPNFRVDAIPSDGVRRITDQLTIWQWSLKPAGEVAYGRNNLAIVIYVPELNRETSILPFTITVTDSRDPLIARAGGDDDTNTLPLVIGGLAVLAVTVGGVGYWQYQRRPSKGKHNKTKIFISYRRADSQGSTGRIFDRLVAEFGKDDVFMDVSTIELGVNFAATLEKAIQACDVVIAIIGTEWATIADDAGNRRLDNENDFVRREIATALRQKKRVIPALVDEALMPSNDQLPEDLKALALHNAIRIHGDSFDQDVMRLIAALLRQGATGPFEMD